MSKKRSFSSIEAIEVEYSKIYPAAARLCDAMRSSIEKAAQAESFQLAFPVEARVKDLEIIVRKIRGGDVENINRLVRIQDLVGLRLVVFFERDVKSACNLVRKTFGGVRREKCITQGPQFGYKTTHLIIDPSAEFLSEIDGLTGMQAEIQVRTLAEHCWAAASHRLHYKSDESVAESIKRPLDRVAALLEIVDSEFERLLDERDKYRQSVAYEPDDAPLNVDNLEAVLRQAFPDQQDWFDSWSVAEILADLAVFGIDTRGKLKNLLPKEPTYLTTLSPEEQSAAAAGDPDDWAWPDESPDAMIQCWLALEYPEKHNEYIYKKAEAAFRDVDLSEYTSENKS